ncbi:hypothetical protein IBB74_13675 [Listeria welshimeri]|uniref:hypothetical protein n=1 Tax=Listeria welshimeri TaxID=1643 RepID=UPI001629BD8D|nr:hypothetical protein [Listeria welshimeri]MBC1405495.1 hypothetical protein [Listeria welshimeri]MBC1608106.1 hypothetical protein [Listeria welshimeri]MBC1611233.1 hypothetical protein [Listeria welshimeri]MBC1640003.1 hypothetical protein [Listeria welshimeri]MBC1643177.1 hypothetical protein [Listeria welshimeri]
MYKLVDSDFDKEKLINQYFFLIGGYIETMMEKFLKEESFGIDSMGLLFKKDLDEEDDEEELQEIKDNQILLVSEPPASITDEKAYFYYAEFYKYLEIYIREKYPDNNIIQKLLNDIKDSIEL